MDSMDTPHDAATRWFEPLYAAAERDTRAVPWAEGVPSPWVVEHLIRHPGPGRAIVVGCGLGDDAEAISAAGYDTVAFDVAASAVEWSRERFPDSSVDYRVADLFDLPGDLVAGGDLVVEVRTVQSLPPLLRDEAIDAVASLVAPGGLLLVVALGRPDGHDPVGPPWALSASELQRFEVAGLSLESAAMDRGQLVRLYRGSMVN